MHAVKPYRVSRARLRCQAITVLISLQLCLLISLEGGLHFEAIYNHVATFATNGDISSVGGRKRGGDEEGSRGAKHIWQCFFAHSAALKANEEL